MTMSNPHQRARTRPQRSRPLTICGGVVGAAAVVLAVPPLAGIPARLIEGCAEWIALAGAFELLSVLGFLVVFKLVFGSGQRWRRNAPVALRSLAASTVLPAGGLLGPVAGAWSAEGGKESLSRLARSSIAFVVLTNAPGVIVLVGLGSALSLGWSAGPHGAALTLVPAAIALVVFVAAWSVRRPSAAAVASGPGAIRRGLGRRLLSSAGVLRHGIADAHGLAVSGNWKLVGALGYYAFDNAALWAAFRAYGRTPPISVIVMAYLIGSLGGALPTPGGLGAVEGGMIGALVLYGAPLAPAVAAVLLYRAISLSFSLVLGGAAWIWAPTRLARAQIASRHRPGARPAPPRPRAAADAPLAASID